MKKINRILFSGLSLASLLLLTGCVSVDKSGNPYGFFWDYFGKPMSAGVEFFANNQGLGFGLGIVLVTLIVRLIIFPLGIYQSNKMIYQSEKMNYFKPYLEPYQDRLKTAETQEEKLAAQQALFAAQKEYGVSPFASMSGCLPIFIQMPFFLGLFAAARYTPGVMDSSFLGIPLGQSSLLFTVLVAVLYYIHGLLTLVGIDDMQKEQMKKMMYMNPIMMAVFSFSSPASLTLYWVVGGFIQIIQQLVINFLVRPSMKKRVAKEFEENPPQVLKSQGRKDVTPKMASAIESKPKNKAKKNRNAGKQRSR